jgi:hypothetical protein
MWLDILKRPHRLNSVTENAVDNAVVTKKLVFAW